MTTPQEHNDFYPKVRTAILGQFFALGSHYRANLVSINNDRPPGLDAGTDPDLLWNVTKHDRDNPLLWSSKLLTTLAVEYQLSKSDDIEKIINLALETIESLFKRHNGDHFDGYIIRCDPTTSDSWSDTWVKEGDGKFNGQFLVDPDSGDYSYCVPHWDFRHVPSRTDSTIRQLLSDSQLEDYNANRFEFKERCRNWEVSADELVGMLAIASVLYELVPTASVRAQIKSKVLRIGDYLAEHGYVLVRPMGGLVYRGPTSLTGFEYAFEQSFHRITGTSFASRTDFVGALQNAGLWRALVNPVTLEAVGFTIGGVLGAPLLGSLLASDPTGGTLETLPGSAVAG